MEVCALTSKEDVAFSSADGKHQGEVYGKENPG